MDSAIVTKEAWRKKLLDLRATIASHDANKSLIICEKLEKFLLLLKNEKTIGFYWPIKNEPDISRAIISWLFERSGRKAALPVTEKGAKGLSMYYREWRPDMTLQYDRWGIGTPIASSIVVPEILVIPCVGFSDHCHRLGYGAGYFDRYLAKCAVRPLTIGLCYHALKVPASLFAPYDMALDYILSEKELIGSDR